MVFEFSGATEGLKEKNIRIYNPRDLKLAGRRPQFYYRPLIPPSKKKEKKEECSY